MDVSIRKIYAQSEKESENKARVEGSIVEAYIIEKILNFSHHYFNPNAHTKLTQIGYNDDGGGGGSDLAVSIFAYPAREFDHERHLTLTDAEFYQAHSYVLLNYSKVDHTLSKCQLQFKLVNVVMLIIVN